MKQIFITGGAGFIASHLIESLIKDYKIIVFDNLAHNALKYTPFLKHKNLKLVKGDVLDPDSLTKAMKNSDIVIHCAAIAGISTVGLDANRTMKVNLIGTYHALEAAAANHVDMFIDFSTSEIYGPFIYKAREDGFATVGSVGTKRWCYAVSKLASEHLAFTYADTYEMRVATVRPFNIYGPRQIGEGAIEQMVLKALANEDITVFNDGAQIRSWCFVKDFVNGIIAIINHHDIKKEVFNIGNPQCTITVLGLAELIRERTGSKSKIVFKPYPGPEVEMRVPDITKACQMLGFKPETDLKTGLAGTIEWYKRHRLS